MKGSKGLIVTYPFSIAAIVAIEEILQCFQYGPFGNDMFLTRSGFFSCPFEAAYLVGQLTDFTSAPSRDQ